MIFNIWLTVAGIQVAIVVLLALQLLKYRNKQPSGPVSFSIVIAAHNELDNLKILIPALLQQKHADHEIIVALDRCTDGSERFLESMTDDRLKFVTINSPEKGYDPKKYALKSGIDKAAKEWIVFTDADCLPSSHLWLDSLESRITPESKIVLGYSPYINKGLFLHHFIQYEAFLTAFHYLSMSLLKKNYMGVGRNMAVNRKFFNDKKGYEDFRSVTGGDDDLFIQKNANSRNTVISLGKNSMVYSVPKNSWRDYFRQKTRHLSVGGRYSVSDQLLHFIFNGSLLLFWLLLPFLSPQIILPIILFYLSVKAIGYRFADSKMGAGFNYILLPLVDFMYAIFLPIIALRSKLVKDIRWKN